jgi:hypothetical protein
MAWQLLRVAGNLGGIWNAAADAQTRKSIALSLGDRAALCAQNQSTSRLDLAFALTPTPPDGL